MTKKDESVFEEHERAVEQAEREGRPKPMDRVFVQLEPEEFPKDSFPLRTFVRWPKKIEMKQKITPASTPNMRVADREVSTTSYRGSPSTGSQLYRQPKQRQPSTGNQAERKCSHRGRAKV